MAAKRGVLRPLVREHLEAIGSHLAWHGSVNVDYLLADSGVPRYIDAIPRLVEPMNAAFSGVNLADLLVRLSLGDPLDPVQERPGVTSHILVQALLGVADRGRTWPGNWPEPRPARGSAPGFGRSSPRPARPTLRAAAHGGGRAAAGRAGFRSLAWSGPSPTTP